MTGAGMWDKLLLLSANQGQAIDTICLLLDGLEWEGREANQDTAQATRQRLAEERAALFREQAESTRAARLALRRVMEREDATPAEILEAARLLAEIGK